MKCLVIGGDSRIGAALVGALQSEGHCAQGTTRRSFRHTLFLDLSSVSSWSPPEPIPDMTYLCAAVNGFAACEADPVQAKWVNATAPAIIAQELTENGGKVVLLSSAAAETKPETAYGRTKLLAEALLLRAGKNAAVVRFGPIIRADKQVFAEGAYLPLTLDDIVRELVDLASRFVPGVHRIVAPRRHLLARRVS